MPLSVRFDNTEEIWNIVVVETKEDMIVEAENNEEFVITYADETEWDAALKRFDGKIPHTVIDLEAMWNG